MTSPTPPKVPTQREIDATYRMSWRLLLLGFLLIFTKVLVLILACWLFAFAFARAAAVAEDRLKEGK